MGEAKRKAKVGVRISHCRTCTLCCSLPEIHALDKPMYRPCRHIENQGCGIFGAPERPGTCRAYECAHLTAQLTNHPDRRRIPHPLEAGAYFHRDAAENALVVFVDPDRPQAWKRSGLVDILRGALRRGMTLVVFDRGRRMAIANLRHFEEIVARDYVAFADAHGMPRDVPGYEAERAAAQSG